MAGLGLMHVGLLLCVVSLCNGQADIRALVNQINLLEQDINEMKVEVPRYETRIINKIGMLETVLRTDLVDSIVPTYIRTQVQTSLTQILGDQTLAAMFNSHFKSEIRHLKLTLQQRIRQLQNHVDGEREKQRQETTKLRQEVTRERQYVERQLNYLQAELAVTRNDLGRLEQDVSFLMNVWVNHTYGSPVQSRESSGQCDCSGLKASVDSHKSQVDKKLKLLESEDVFLFKSVVFVNKSHVEDMITLRNDVQNFYDNSKADMNTLNRDMNIKVNATKQRLNEIAQNTEMLFLGLGSVCDSVGIDCVTEEIETPEFSKKVTGETSESSDKGGPKPSGQVPLQSKPSEPSESEPEVEVIDPSPVSNEPSSDDLDPSMDYASDDMMSSYGYNYYYDYDYSDEPTYSSESP